MRQRMITLARKCATLLFVTGSLLLTAVTGTMAAGKSDTTRFPQESLIQRIQRIEQLKHVRIAFDETMIRDLAARAMTADQESSTEMLLEESLKSSNLSYKKYGKNNYSIIRKQVAPVPEEPDKTTAAKGSISGTVLDEAGESLVGATILVTGTTIGTVTDLNGQYVLKQVPAGTHTIEVRFISYQTQQVSEVQVTGGKTTRLDLVMKPASEELGEVVVKAGYKQASAEGLYARQQSSMQLVDGISADLIKKTSDNNVAQVLKRVSGVTIDKGKYVTVRGMSERYNNVQLNGSSLPSTEPNRRNFSFDVIPSSLVDNVTIAKTFTPDMPGEFVGGLVEVNTLAVPDEKFLTITAGTGMNTNSTGNNFLSNKRYSGDWLFGEMDDRKWYTGRTEEASLVNIENAGQKNTYGLRQYTAAPVQSYAVSAGLPVALGDNQRLGVVVALTYRNEQTIEDITEGTMITRDSLYKDSWRNRFVTATGAVGNVGWAMPGHKINWRNLFNNRFTHTNQERYIYKYYEGYNFAEQYSVVLQSRLWQTQLDGEHQFFQKHLQVDWNLSYNKVTRTNPDDRLVTGTKQGETADGDEVFYWMSYTMVGDPSLGGSGNSLNIGEGHVMYSKLEETKKNAGIDLAYNFTTGNNRQTLKAGYLGTFRRSDFNQQYLKGMYTTLEVNNWIGQSPQEMFSAERFADGSLTYVISGMQGDKADYYHGKQDVHAGYLMGEFSLLRKLHLTTGARVEKTKTEVTTELTSGQDRVDSLVVLDKTDWLPATSLVYNITTNLNARAAYSRTLSRPDFRELSLNNYYNVDDRVWVINQGTLKQSQTDNYDLRLEWFPRAGEVFSVSAFYKEFTNPIELVTRMTSSQQSFYMYSVNLDEATAKGLELNMRKSLGFVAPGAFLENLYLSGNASIIKGDVTYNLDELLEMPSVKEDRSRPLLGLSPYTVNTGLTYEGLRFGAAVNYGREGQRLVTSGDEAKYDQYEASRDVLDLQLSARFLQQKMEIKLNASDILNQDVIVYRNTRIVEWTLENPNPETGKPGTEYLDLTGDKGYNPGDQVMSRIKKGVNLSLSVSYTF